MKQKKTRVLNYSVVFEEDAQKGYAVWVPDLPGCASQGNTLDEAKKNIKEAILLYIEDMPEEKLNPKTKPQKQFVIPIKISFPSYGKIV